MPSSFLDFKLKIPGVSLYDSLGDGPLDPARPYQPIAEWHLCISGFTQNLGRPSGLQVLWQQLRSRHHNGKVCVELCTWNDNFAHLAEFIWRFRPADGRVRICVYAYSWGGGCVFCVAGGVEWGRGAVAWGRTSCGTPWPHMARGRP